MSRRSSTLIRALRTYKFAVSGAIRFSAPQAGWPSNDTLRQTPRPSRVWPAGDKNVRYVALPSGIQRIGA